MLQILIKMIFIQKRDFKSIDPNAIEERLIAQGCFHLSEYSTVRDFLTELTGEIHKSLNLGSMLIMNMNKYS